MKAVFKELFSSVNLHTFFTTFALIVLFLLSAWGLRTIFQIVCDLDELERLAVLKIFSKDSIA